MLATIGRFDGEEIFEATLSSEAGATARIMTWGAVVHDLQVPLANGRMQRVVLGFADFADYPAHSPSMGAIPGRYANRIGNGHLEIDGKTYQLTLNQLGRHHLHGGARGFGKRPWRIVGHGARFVTLACESPDGDEGYPGRLTAVCTYTLAEPATLRVEMTATADAPTVINLCNHCYFNLEGTPTIEGHTLSLEADFITPVDGDMIPTGEMHAVAGTPFDFRRPRPVGLVVEGQPFAYDINFVLRRPAGLFERIATLKAPTNGLAMEVWTDQPGVQLYDGFKLAPKVPGWGDIFYGARAGLCLETQRFPDTPNKAHFGDATLRPGETYRHVVEYRFAP